MRRRRTTPNEKGYTEARHGRRREDDQLATVEQRVFETVLWGLNEPLHVRETLVQAGHVVRRSHT
jgi:hypothetical protein